MQKDYFAPKADSYEQNKQRVDNVAKIANAIIASTRLDKSMHLMDFGSGTGLLLERIAPFVRKITAVDISTSMNRLLAEKRNRLGCELELIEVDLAKTDITGEYDGVISSMTMHHIQDIESVFFKLHNLVKPGGFIAIADLDREDGNFHTEDTGVFHFGFDREYIVSAAESAGFTSVKVSIVNVIQKPQGDFRVFLLTGSK
jgi:cyclopropane fatty-acyl-phospholipid synthase-like methyltransferase